MAPRSSPRMRRPSRGSRTPRACTAMPVPSRFGASDPRARELRLLLAVHDTGMGSCSLEVPLRIFERTFRIPVDEPVVRGRVGKLVLIGSPNKPSRTALSMANAVRLAAEVPSLLGIYGADRDFCG